MWTIEKLSDKAYEEIKKKIIQGELPPGSRLVDSLLGERYGISRTPMRDAIRRLVEEGLVISNTKKGYFVFKPTSQDIMEIYELRLILDKAVVSKLINEIFPNDRQFYLKAAQELSDWLNKEIVTEQKHFIQYDEYFHGSLVRLVNNSRLSNIYDDNRAQTKIFRYQTSMSQERIETANKLHIELIECIKNLDIEGALRTVTAHVEMSRRDALADLNAAEANNDSK
jgi:DNA-binding GntR family transcriptional regulator